MYSKEEEQLQKSVDELLSVEEEYKTFVNRFKLFYERREEWILFFHEDLITRNANTNNYAEASIRILKDIVLCRTKAFNAVALTDFCVSVWETYFQKRLLEHAFNRDQRKSVFFRNLCSKMKEHEATSIEQIDESTYLVPSEDGNKTYTINTAIGTCTCSFGTQGAFCKHLAFLAEKKCIYLPNAPPVNAAQRHIIGHLALGDKCPSMSFFEDYRSVDNDFTDKRAKETDNQNSSRDLTISLDCGSDCVLNSLVAVDDSVCSPAGESENPCSSLTVVDSEIGESLENPTELEILDVKLSLTEELKRISSLIDETNVESCKKMVHFLKKINTADQLNSVNLNVCKTFLKCGRKGSQIKVQPTAIARRRPTVTKGSKRVPSGRPASNAPQQRAKRPRTLSKNINNNVLHAKSHGGGH